MIYRILIGNEDLKSKDLTSSLKFVNLLVDKTYLNANGEILMSVASI